MNIHIRNASIHDYHAVEAIMRQVQQMHIDWRPDIYKHSEAVLPATMFEQAVRDQTLFVADCEGRVAGVLMIQYRHIESTNQVTRDVLFIDTMAVDEHYQYGTVVMQVIHTFNGEYFRLQVEIFDSITIDLITEYPKTSENVDYF